MKEVKIMYCPRCGGQMIERHCKRLCLNCGLMEDCSDG